jgi:DNA-binding transcriptional LysR family regulator
MRVAERRTVVDLGDVKAFLAVARAGSFSRAAEELATAKSVVSRRVTRLEGDLGTRLFTRSSKGVVPTEEGEALRVQAGGAFEQLDDALQSAARRTGELTGVLRITAPVAFGTAHLSSFLSDFMREHPRLSIDASFSDRRVDILADGVDVAVRMGALPDSTLVARRIAPLRLAVLASPDYLARNGTPSRPRELLAHDCIVYGMPDGDLWRFREGERSTSVRITGRFRSDNPASILAAALAGLGIAGLPTFMLGDAIATGALTPLLTAFPIAEEALFALRPPGPPAAKTRAFIDALANRFGPEPYWDPCSRQDMG